MLIGAQLAEDDHLRPRSVRLGPLVEQLGRRPRITQPDRGVSTDPKRDDGTVELLGQFFEIEPGFVLWEQMCIANYGEREWSWRLFMKR